MKLVNVEDLKVLVAVESKGEIRYGKLVTDLFDDISTVEAIPIKFIKKYYEDITVPYSDTRIQFEELIRKWEKENDKGSE